MGSWVWDTVRNYFKNVKVTFPLFQRQCSNKRQNILVLFFSAAILNLICTNQSCVGWIVINRGYYKVTRGYEISLPVLKNISWVSAVNKWNIFLQHKKRNFVSPSSHVMFYLLNKHQWNSKPFYLKIVFFGLKGAVYYEAIATVIFSHVKIACYFHMWKAQLLICEQTTDSSVGCVRNAWFPIAISSQVPCDGVYFVIFFQTFYNKTIIIRFSFCDILIIKVSLSAICLGLRLGW